MKQQNSSTPPIACTLTGKNLKARLASIAALMRDALQSFQRRGLVLDLSFNVAAAERVRDMVRKEQDCCSFLTFDLREDQRPMHLTITAPEAVGEAADFLFQEFLGFAKRMPKIGCAK